MRQGQQDAMSARRSMLAHQPSPVAFGRRHDCDLAAVEAAPGWVSRRRLDRKQTLDPEDRAGAAEIGDSGELPSCSCRSTSLFEKIRSFARSALLRAYPWCEHALEGFPRRGMVPHRELADHFVHEIGLDGRDFRHAEQAREQQSSGLPRVEKHITLESQRGRKGAFPRPAALAVAAETSRHRH
jgi:hypothetical protein